MRLNHSRRTNSIKVLTAVRLTSSKTVKQKLIIQIKSINVLKNIDKIPCKYKGVSSTNMTKWNHISHFLNNLHINDL